MPIDTSVQTVLLREYDDEFVNLTDQDADFVFREFKGKINIRRDFRTPAYILNPGPNVGVITLPSGRQMEIRPKIPIRNLFYMLAVAFQVPPFRREVARLDRLNEILEFVAIFFAELVEERIANGLYRWYVEREENLGVVRGRIYFPEHLRHNFVSRQLTYCQFDDFTWDIPENQIVRQVVHLLSGWAFRSETTRRLRQLDSELSEVARTQFPSSAIDLISYHRLNEDYRRLHHLCRLFLEGASLSENVGVFDFRAFLLDMNKLFEEFVCQLLRDRIPKGYGVDLQERIYLDGARKIQMKPDIVISRSARVVLVADCKYKRLEANEFKNHDIYQLLAYCSATAVKRGVLIYPLHLIPAGEDVQILNSDFSLRQICIDLSKGSRELDEDCSHLVNEIVQYSVC
jgi:5-methylcytosine-specific restriction enzyme subunit McrC